MTASTHEVVPYQRELKDGVIALWATAFDADAEEKRRYFEWKYEQNPYLSAPILFVALDKDERVIGTRGFHGSRWRSPGGSMTVPCAEDFAIAPAHRNGTLATSIMKAALDDLAQRGYEFVMSASGGQATVLHSLAMGWKSVGAMAPVARRAGRHGRALVAVDQLARKARKYWRPGRRTRARYRDLMHGKPFRRLDRAAGRSRSKHGGTIVVESSPDPLALAEVVARLPDEGRIRHVRDAAFYEWRFANPSREYRFLLSQRDGQLDGYMVIARAQSVPFQISDWEGTSHAVRAELLDFALSEGGFVALGAWTGCLPVASRELLESSGFRPTEMELRARGMPCVLLKKLGAADGDWSISGAPALDPSGWDIRLIDSMHG